VKVIAGGDEFDLGTVEKTPTVSMVDYSRRETDDFGVTTVVRRGFSRRLSVRMALPFDEVDGVQQLLASLRATPAQWIVDESLAWLSVTGFYKDFEIDLAVPPVSFCTLTIEGLAETETVEDEGGDPAPSGSPSTLQLVQPQDIDDDVLTSTSVDEFDYPQWSAMTTYAAGDRVLRLVSHRIHESAAAGNTGHDPADDDGHWIDVGATNAWAMFDQALGSVTTALSSIVVVLDVTDVSAVALLDVTGATVRVQAAGYDDTQEVGAGAVTFLDLPDITGAVTVTVAGTGDVSVGTLLIGKLVSLGLTESSPTAGITDYSKKETDDFGDVTIVERAWAKRMAPKALIRTEALDDVANRIAAVRARPCLWIGDAELDSLTVYGFFKDFSIEVGENVSALSLTIEGLSQAAPRGTGLGGPVNWTDVVDNDPAHPKPDDGADVTGEHTAADSDALGGVPATTVLDAQAAADSAIAAAQSDITALQALGTALGEQADDLADSIDSLFDDVVASAIDIATLESTVATQGSAITTNTTALTTLTTNYSSLSSTVSALGSTVSSNSTAISTLNTNVASLTTRVSAGARNLVTNSSFEDGLTGWAVGAGSWTTRNDEYGTYARSASTGTPYMDNAPANDIPVSPSSTYTLSADLYVANPGVSGAAYIRVLWLDAGHAFISATPPYAKLSGPFTTDLDGRIQGTATSPPTAAYARIRFGGDTLSGTPVIAFRQIKCENAAQMSPFTQEASVIQSFTAISTLDGQVSTLTSTVSTQGASITSNASAISTTNSNLATLTSTVTSQGSTITSQASTLSTLSSNYSTLSSTVSAQGASITSNSSAISTLNSNVTTAFARYALTLDVNGYAIGWELNNNGTSGSIKFRADLFEVSGVSSGARTTFASGTWKVYDASGNLRTENGYLP
jgi:peptidoglycan hydrolase CwlO-like protein